MERLLKKGIVLKKRFSSGWASHAQWRKKEGAISDDPNFGEGQDGFARKGEPERLLTKIKALMTGS